MSLLAVDAAAILAVLLAEDGDSVANRMADQELVAPHVLPFEVANVLRRQWSGGVLSAAAAELALDSFASLAIDLWPFEAVATQIWALRGQMTAYDAAYVALAELLQVPLLTGDSRLAAAARANVPHVKVEVA
ncbi:MAG: type II toxin-antitoxin system VapC family toxin [Bifidobacteriaceae bacterium]|nr:type II toxin-antitoxin system VapC family toxin [Bifidobacteriaceae bacterium]